MKPFLVLSGAVVLHKAAFNGHLECIKYLLDSFKQAPSKPLQRDKNAFKRKDYAAALASAKEDGGDDALLATIDINCQDESGSTPLHKACFKGNVECAKLLLERGASPLAKDHQGSTPLHSAVQSQSKECVQLLLDLLAPLPAASPSNDEEAKAKQSEEKTEKPDEQKEEKKKEKEKANQSGTSRTNEGVNVADNDLFTPLHIAVCMENIELVRMLLARGAHVNFQNALGRTPLFYAVRAGYAVPSASPLLRVLRRAVLLPPSSWLCCCSSLVTDFLLPSHPHRKSPAC